MSSPQEPPGAPTGKPGGATTSRFSTWIRLNWHLLVPVLAVIASLLIAGGSLWNASIHRQTFHQTIRDEYENRFLATEHDLREEIRHIRSELTRLQERIATENDQEDEHRANRQGK